MGRHGNCTFLIAKSKTAHIFLLLMPRYYSGGLPDLVLRRRSETCGPPSSCSSGAFGDTATTWCLMELGRMLRLSRRGCERSTVVGAVLDCFVATLLALRSRCRGLGESSPCESQELPSFVGSGLPVFGVDSPM
jgi:hypothetical protein